MTLSLWLNVLAFLVAVCILVTVHEFGHFWVARLLGFKVLRFSVGFGTALWKRVAGPDKTEYVIAAIPLGGYVKMLDEREAPVEPSEVHRAFNRRPHWQRIVVLLAGPAFNILFAIVVLTGVLMVSGMNEVRPLIDTVTAGSPAARAGLGKGDEIVAVNGKSVPGLSGVVLGLLDGVTARAPVSLTARDTQGRERTVQLDLGTVAQRRQLSEPAALMTGLGIHFIAPPTPAVLGTVEADGPAARAGLRAGDRILTVNGEPVADFETLAQRIHAHAGDSMTLQYLRDGQSYTARVTAAADEQGGVRIGRIHVGPLLNVPYPPSMLHHVALGPIGALSQAAVQAWDMTTLQGRLVWRMLVGQVSIKNLSGPITMAQLAGDSASAGASAFLGYLVLVSLALGFMNLLPIPILDGGQVVMQIIEWIKGSPLSERAQAAGQQVGFAMVGLLLLLALFNDIARQFG
ncbi:MAG TPA: RIP metalloprotease RseP [Steroidobacteraceae bacterium]